MRPLPVKLRETLLGELLHGVPLTPQEEKVLAGAALGERVDDTAERMFLSPETVRSYRKRIFAKLGARNAPHAVYEAIRLGILTVPLDHEKGGAPNGTPPAPPARQSLL